MAKDRRGSASGGGRRGAASQRNAVQVELSFTPQPRQALLHRCAANEILYGGAAGGGKSAALRAEALFWCLAIPGLQAYLFRRTFPELERNHILKSQQEFPAEVGRYLKDRRRYEFHNGSKLHFCHCQYEDNVHDYQGAEIDLLLIDELTHFTEFMYVYLRGRTRVGLDVPREWQHKIPGIICASNPGGVGHDFVKRFWVDPAEPGEIWRAPPEEGGFLRCYIPAKLSDNPILQKRNPNYINQLRALPEPYRTAYMTGDWDIFLGQMFAFRRDRHIIDPVPIPSDAPIYMTFDWGFGAPFSVGWWWVDADGRLYRFAEWYGWNGTPNQGLRLTDQEIARGIREREYKLGLDSLRVMRYAGHDCFQRRPDYRGGGQGPSTAEEFAKFGVHLVQGDSTRHLKVRQFHQRLMLPEDGGMPMMVVYRGCEHFIRTIPVLQADRSNPEDVDTTMEDHVYDEACHILMARPLGLRQAERRKGYAERRIEALYRGDFDPWERHMWVETMRSQQFWQGEPDWGEVDEYDDGALVSTAG